MKVSNLSCNCGEVDLVSITSGHDEERAPGGFAVRLGRAPRGWCLACWLQKFEARQPVLFE